MIALVKKEGHPERGINHKISISITKPYILKHPTPER
jgi:hypothetical protein